MKKKLMFLTLVVAAVAVGIIGYSKDSRVNNEEDSKIKIMASIYPIEQFAKIIGGDKVEVNTMVPDGAEPHDFEPKAKDIVKLNKSDLFVYNGLQMESWVDKVISTIDNKDLVIVNSSKDANIIENSDEEHEEHEEHEDHELEESHEGHNHGAQDPHIWLGLDEAAKQSKLIMDALIKIDSKNKEYYEKNYNSFVVELNKLKDEYKVKFEAKGNKDFITGHAAFAYLCRDFGLEQRSLEGVFGEGEVTPKQLKDLANYCKDNNIKTIFMPDTASEKLSKTLATEVGAKVVKISSLETSTTKTSYIDTMRSNLETIYDNI